MASTMLSQILGGLSKEQAWMLRGRLSYVQCPSDPLVHADTMRRLLGTWPTEDFSEQKGMMNPLL